MRVALLSGVLGFMLYPAIAYEVSYTLEAPGNVSLAIYDAGGNLIRELLRGQPTEKGTHVKHWDGLDRFGMAQPPGDYQWKLLRTPGFEAKYLGMVGINVVEQPYDPWVGNNQGPSAVAWDESGWYVGSIASENIATFRKQSPDSRRRLWQKNPMEAWQGPRAMAVHGETLLVLQQNGKVVPLLAATGAHRNYTDDQGKQRPVAWDVRVPGDSEPGLMDMDAHGDIFVISDTAHNQVSWYAATPLAIPARTSATALQELTTAKLLRNASIPNPKGVALGAEQVLYVISDGAVLAVGDEIKPFITADALVNPILLSFDHHTGELLVAEGAPAHQIKRYNAQGHPIATYGRQGGRLDGPFVSGDFMQIRDLAATADGGFLVCEDGVRRTATFDRAGTTQGEWFGGSPFFNFASATDEQPEEIWFYAGARYLGVARMDYEQGTWQLLASYSLQSHDGLFPVHDAFNHWRVLQRNGQTYLLHDTAAILRRDQATQRLLPVALARNIDKKTAPDIWLNAVAAQNLDLAKLSGAFSWADLNGDGAFQAEEFRFGNTAYAINSPGHCYLDAQWNVTFSTGGRSISPWVTLTNQAAEGSLAPVWDWNTAEIAVARWPQEIIDAGGVEPRGLWRDGEGAVYQFVAFQRMPTADRHGAAWPGNRNGAARIIKWHADGTLAWNVGQHAHTDPWWDARPGEYHDPARILGITHGCLVVADRSGWPATAWTTDGLYAGSFLDRRADDGLDARLYHWWREKRPIADAALPYANPNTVSADTPIPYDCLSGGSMMTLSDGELCWLPAGENATPVYRIRGWDGWERQLGHFKVTEIPPQAMETGSGLSAAYFANLNLEGEPVHRRLDSRIWFAHKSDREKWQAWSNPPVPGIGVKGFSARWSGYLEPRLSESYVFSVYLGPADRVRLWIDEILVIDDWEPGNRRRPKVTWANSDEVSSVAIALSAGVRVPIRLEYANDGPEVASLSLNWNSATQERQRIPAACLYPAPEE